MNEAKHFSEALCKNFTVVELFVKKKMKILIKKENANMSNENNDKTLSP